MDKKYIGIITFFAIITAVITIIMILNMTKYKISPVNPYNNIEKIEHDVVESNPYYVQTEAGNVYSFNGSINGDKTILRTRGHAFFHDSLCKKNIQTEENKEISNLYNKLGNKKVSSISTVKNGKIMPYLSTNVEKLCRDALNNDVGYEDARLFRFKNEIWVITVFRGDSIKMTNVEKLECGHHMIMFKYDHPEDKILLKYPNKKKIEKNWMPFEYEDELYVVYEVDPHIILKVDIITGECEKVYEEDFGMFDEDLGGGPPPIKVKIMGKDYFLTIAHIRANLNFQSYRKNFFYAFESKPPFKPVLYTDMFSFNKKSSIEFLTGLDVKKDKILVSYGVNDCSNEISKMDLSEIVDLLKPLSHTNSVNENETRPKLN